MLIENELNLFIRSEENNGALLITGEWGCGKSYLIKKYVDDLNSKKEFAIAVISLFGVDNIASLNAKVRDAYLEFTSSVFGKKAQRIYGTLKKVAIDSAKITAAALPDSTAASAVSMGVSSVLSFNPLNFIKVKNTVGLGDEKLEFALVFDDFERCNIDKKDLLGAINEYAENKAIKVIIVADEAKINDDSYKEFKEKVVARTLRMISDYPAIINSIIEKYKSSNYEYKEFLLKNTDCIIGAFTHSGYDNLRTLKSCLMDFERVFDGWCQAGIPLDDIENVFYKFCAITYEAKKGNYAKGSYGMYNIAVKETDQEKKDKIVKRIKSKYLDGTFDYIPSSISKWVVSGEWDKQTFLRELKRMYHSENLSHEEKFIQYRFWNLEQEDINFGMPSLVARAYNGEASRDELIVLLQKAHALRTYKISLPCEVDYKKINQGLDARFEKVKNGTIQEPESHMFTENSQIDEEAIPINARIEKMGDLMYVWESRRLLISYLRGDKNISQYSLKNKCIEAFDDELYQLFTARYLSSSNGDRIDLCRILLGIDFKNSHYSTSTDQKITLKNYGILITMLKGLSEKNSASIDNAIHNSFIEQLEHQVVEMSPSDKV